MKWDVVRYNKVDLDRALKLGHGDGFFAFGFDGTLIGMTLSDSKEAKSLVNLLSFSPELLEKEVNNQSGEERYVWILWHRRVRCFGSPI